MPWLVLFVLFGGLLMWLLLGKTAPRAGEVGKWMFICALVGLMIAAAPDTVAKFRRF